MIVAASQTMAAKAKVTMMWLVTVKLPGIMPSRFSTRMKMKIENTQGKYFMPSSPRFSFTILAMNSYSSSAIDCTRVGINERPLACEDQEADDCDKRNHHEQRRVREGDIVATELQIEDLLDLELGDRPVVFVRAFSSQGDPLVVVLVFVITHGGSGPLQRLHFLLRLLRRADHIQKTRRETQNDEQNH